jgi:multisubunit Na+/H+ antiporter MnhF subunit
MNFEIILASILLLNLVVSLLFILKTKSHGSKMLITLLFSTTGVAVLLLLFGCQKSLHLFLDVALIFVLLSAITAIVFAKRLRFIKRGGNA